MSRIVSVRENEKRITTLEELTPVVAKHTRQITEIQSRLGQIQINQSDIGTILTWKPTITNHGSRISSLETKVPKIEVNAREIQRINGVISVVPVHTQQINTIQSQLPQIETNRNSINRVDSTYRDITNRHQQKLDEHDRTLVPWSSVSRVSSTPSWNDISNKVPFVANTGVMKVGQYIDFIRMGSGSTRHTYRLENNGDNTLKGSGSLAIPELILGGYKIKVVE